MSSEIYTHFATSDTRKKQEQHLHELWPGDEEYRRFHRTQLTLANLTLVALRKAILKAATRKTLLDAVPDQGGNSRVELHLLLQQLHGWFAMSYVAPRLVRAVHGESHLQEAFRDYPNRVDLQWCRISRFKDPWMEQDLLAADQHAIQETQAILQECQDWALAQLKLQKIEIDVPIQPVSQSQTIEISTPIEPYMPYAELENRAALMMFGFKVGLKTFDVALQFQPELGKYRLMKMPPQSSQVFTSIFLRANSRKDITEISAESNEIMTQPNGTELRQRWQDYSDLLETVFGKGEITDFIMNTSKGHEGNWLKHLKQELNELRCSWTRVKDTHSSTGIKSVELWASSHSPNSGKLNLRFTLFTR